MESAELQALIEKWKPVLEFDGVDPITDRFRLGTTAVLLENQLEANKALLSKDRSLSLTNLLSEAAPVNAMGASSSVAGDGHIDLWDPVLISMVRRSMPNLMAYDVCGVQPMSGPVGLVFALRARYSAQNGIEALFNEANTTFAASAAGNTESVTAAGAHTGGDASVMVAGNTGYITGKGMTTAAGEAIGDSDDDNGWNEMAFSIEKVSVTAKERALKAEYTHELSQDLKAVHGLDAEAELARILSGEILAEINREVIRSIYITATIGSQQNTAQAGYFDLDVDSNGRWMEEKFKGLLFQVDREANAIVNATRAGKGNIVITSPDVASALAMVGVLKAPESPTLKVDATGNTFVGTIRGDIKIYIDPYFTSSAGNQFVVVGYKGSSPFDAGLFYCPYVPLQMYKTLDPKKFSPKLGFKTRYGMVSHPFATDVADGRINAGNKNKYYRIFAVKNIV